MAKKSNDYDILADQIGSIGGEENTPKTMGKLQHKSSYGQKEDLSQEEKQDMEAFLQRQAERSTRVFNDETQEDPNVAEGWIPVDRAEMGIRSQFYPESWQFYIRPATVQAIKNWLSIDESNLMQLNKVFTEIIKFCVKISANGSVVSWSNVNSWDRFWFILKVRQLTFASNKKTISFEDDCPECDQPITFELRPESLHYEFPDEDLVEQYWNGTNWTIDPQEYDIDHDIITLYTPTLAKETAIIEWAQREHERGKKLDEIFPKFALWMINKPSKDPDMFEKQIKKVYNEYKSWDITYYKFLDQVVNNITINPRETLKQICPHCGEEVISQVKFPNGVKVLFDVETGAKKFGSR